MWPLLLRIRALVTEAIEPRRAAGRLGKSLDAAVTLTGDTADPLFPALARHRDLLPELFIVSQVTVNARRRARADREHPALR